MPSLYAVAAPAHAMSFYQPDDSASGSQLGGGSLSDGDLNFYSFFGGLLVAEQEDRAAALQSIHEQIIAAAREEKSERDNDAAASAGADATSQQQAAPDASPNAVPPAQLLSVHLPHILRLALACPLEDIRRGMTALLAELAAIDPARYAKYQSAMQFAFQPSSFVPLSSCVDPTGRTDHSPVSSASGGSSADACGETSNLLEDIFLSTGRTSHCDLLMAWHPSYLTVYTGCINHLMEDAGPLPTAWRPYLAIMAAARHQCEYLISFQEAEFLLKGGDPSWLKGIAYAPKKLQSLAELNALLAHQPWLITRHHIASLTGGAEAGTDSWSVAELVHAVVILTTFHALCGFVYGMGIRKEIDAMDWSAWEPSKAAAPAPLQRKATVQPAAAGADQPAAGSASSTPLHASTPQPFQSPSLTPSASASGSAPMAKSPLSDGEHLLRLLSSSTVTDLRGSGSGGNGFNAAVEEMGTSPASSGDAPNRAAPTPTAAAAKPATADFSLGEGLTGGSSGHAAPTLGSLSNLLRNTHLDTNNPATRYVLLDPSASASSAASTTPSSLAASAAAAAARATATMRYVNFDVNSKSYSTFFLHDYSWKEHGYPLVNRFYQGFAQMLDSEWDLIFSLTYNTVAGARGVDTTPFRRSIWYFTHRLYGLQHDDYDYNRIPVFLTQALKTFVRKIACAPETITVADYELRGYGFKADEKCHIVLLAIEARRQASLLYALHSVMRFMGSN